MMHYSQIRVSQSSQSQSRKIGQKSEYVSRQNDPAYHREVQYTWSESNTPKFNLSPIHETVRMLCKDQGLNIPVLLSTPDPEAVIYTLKQFNELVEMYMEESTPINRLIPVSR